MIIWFKPIDKAIIQYLAHMKRPVTINEVSKSVGISWTTAKGHLTNLRKRGFIEKAGNYWRIDKKVLMSIKKSEIKN